MSWSQISADQVQPQPWKNGGGSTRELLAWPHAHDWALRISVAAVERDGPFSAYPGVQRWLAVRMGIGLPHLQAANWYASGQLDLTNDLWRPVYTDPQVRLIDLAAEYLGRTPIVPDRLDWLWRAGLGATFLSGEVTRIDTLPSCTLPERPVCPHWQTVGRLSGDVPVVLPAVRLTTGLALRLGDQLSVGAEVGLRGTPWAGLSATFGL